MERVLLEPGSSPSTHTVRTILKHGDRRATPGPPASPRRYSSLVARIAIALRNGLALVIVPEPIEITHRCFRSDDHTLRIWTRQIHLAQSSHSLPQNSTLLLPPLPKNPQPLRPLPRQPLPLRRLHHPLQPLQLLPKMSQSLLHPTLPFHSSIRERPPDTNSPNSIQSIRILHNRQFRML